MTQTIDHEEKLDAHKAPVPLNIPVPNAGGLPHAHVDTSARLDAENVINNLLQHPEGRTDPAKDLIVRAMNLALSLEHAILDAPHLFYAMTNVPDGPEGLNKRRISSENLRNACWQVLHSTDRIARKTGEQPKLSPNIFDIDQEATEIALQRERGNRKVQLLDYLDAIATASLRSKFKDYLGEDTRVPTEDMTRLSVASVEQTVDRELHGLVTTLTTIQRELADQKQLVRAAGNAIGIFDLGRSPVRDVLDELHMDNKAKAVDLIRLEIKIDGIAKYLEKRGRNIRNLSATAVGFSAFTAFATAAAIIYLLFTR